MNEIILGDCLDVMKTFPDNHFTGIVTDPPYGLGFMGKHWDAGLPHDDIWREALRVVKPGSHLLAFGGTRTYHRLTCAVEDAGWEIRDCVLYWGYGSGFPKSHNHFGIPGYGTALKPAYEPIIMAMKPLDGTFKQNSEKWGLAGLNIDGCRVGSKGGTAKGSFPNQDSKSAYGDGLNGACDIVSLNKGRWPANLILDEEAAEQLGKPSRFFYCAKTSSRERNEGLEGLSLKENSGKYGHKRIDGRNVPIQGGPQKNNHPTVKPLSLMRYLITLISPPKDALILDPFAGSGSTIVAAQELGIKAIGIEKHSEYAEIARARVAHTAQKVQKVKDQMELFE